MSISATEFVRAREFFLSYKNPIKKDDFIYHGVSATRIYNFLELIGAANLDGDMIAVNDNYCIKYDNDILKSFYFDYITKTKPRWVKSAFMGRQYILDNLDANVLNPDTLTSSNSV